MPSNKSLFSQINISGLIILIILWLCGYLLLQGLGNNYFWDDESYTAMFSRNLLNSGGLNAWDGRNLIAYENGQELNDQLVNIFIPRLQCYITAISFYLFGVSTLSARLPFVIIGFLSVFVFINVLKELKMNGNFIILSTITFTFTPSFLLYSRQCRYYALVIFLSLCVYYFYLKLMNSNKKPSIVFFLLSSLLLFYAHIFSFACFFSALVITHLIYNFRRITFKNYIFIVAVFFMFIGIYALRNNLLSTLRSNIPNTNIHGSWISIKVSTLYGYFIQLNTDGWLPWGVALGLISLLIFTNKTCKLHILCKEWLTFSLLFVLFAAIFIPKEFLPANRCIIILLPFFAGLTAAFLSFMGTKSKLLFIFFLPLIIFTNIFCINPLKPNISSPMLGYIHEIQNNYITPYEAIVSYLDEHSQKYNRVYISPSYMNFPVMFYLGDKLVFCGLLDKNTALPKEKIKALNNELFIGETIPDWIIICGIQNMPENLLKRLSQQGIKYQLINILNIYWQDTTRPEPLWHSFTPVSNFNPLNEGILILKKTV